MATPRLATPSTRGAGDLLTPPTPQTKCEELPEPPPFLLDPLRILADAAFSEERRVNGRNAGRGFTPPISRNNSFVDDKKMEDEEESEEADEEKQLSERQKAKRAEKKQLFVSLKLRFEYVDCNGRIYCIRASEGDAVHCIAEMRQWEARQTGTRDAFWKARRERMERERAIDEYRELTRDDDPDATEDEVVEGEDQQVRGVDPNATESEDIEQWGYQQVGGVDPDATQGEGVEEKEDRQKKAAADASMADSKTGGKGKGKGKRKGNGRGNGKGKGNERDLPLSEVIDNGEGPSQPRNDVAPLEVPPPPFPQPSPGTTQRHYENKYPKIPYTDGTPKDGVRYSKAVLALPQCLKEAETDAERKKKTCDTMNDVVRKSSEVGRSGLFHGDDDPDRLEREIKARKAMHDLDLQAAKSAPKLPLGSQSTAFNKYLSTVPLTAEPARSAKPKRKRRGAATVVVKVSVAASSGQLILSETELKAPPAKSAELKRKRSGAADADVKDSGAATSPSPEKKRKVSLKINCPEQADPKHKDHEEYMAELRMKRTGTQRELGPGETISAEGSSIASPVREMSVLDLLRI
ncbi:hypothetical protein P7C71_g3510, partial [Lecanoromycetidae sp. Uapishka_2]